MSFNFATGFSLCYGKIPLDRDMVETVLFSEIDRFEISGEMFESDEFAEIYKKFFLLGKKIFSIHEILPINISRNWSSSPDNIKKDLVNHLLEKVRLASDKGVEFFRIDLALDSIKAGFEVQELNVRSALLTPVLAEAEQCGITLCHPLRFPKAYPKSQEWRFGTMLISSLLHKNFKIEVDAFPAEVSESKLHNLMKKLFYYPEVIRLRYEPAMDGGIAYEQFKAWMDSLRGQGFKGTIIFSPVFDSLESLQIELEKVNNLIAQYKSSENEETEEDE